MRPTLSEQHGPRAVHLNYDPFAQGTIAVK